MDKPDLPAHLEDFIEAVNRGDTESFLAFFSSSGMVNDWGTKYVGHAAIRTWSDREFIGDKVSLVVTSCEQQDDRVSILAKVGGDGFNGPSSFVFVLHDGKVQEMLITES